MMRLNKSGDEHKYCHGHALVLVGGAGRGGAGRLAARGGLRVGAGLVTVGCPSSALVENAARLDAVMLTPVDSPEDLAGFLGDRRVNTVCLGPGLGSERARMLVPAVLSARRATLLDADALTAFADHPEGLFRMLHPRCLITPHRGEFCRVFPDLGAELALPESSDNPLVVSPRRLRGEVVAAAARRCGCTVLLKGGDTWISSPEGEVRCVSAPPDGSAAWLATAGSGDVLSGFCTGLMARGMEPLEAAEYGVRLHFECGRLLGPGLIAEDLPEAIPAVLRAMGCGPGAAG